MVCLNVVFFVFFSNLVYKLLKLCFWENKVIIRYLYCVKNCFFNNGVGGIIFWIFLCIIFGIKLVLKIILFGCKKNVICLFKYLWNCVIFWSSFNFLFFLKWLRLFYLYNFLFIWYRNVNILFVFFIVNGINLDDLFVIILNWWKFFICVWDLVIFNF